jgi:hypothetical protein
VRNDHDYVRHCWYVLAEFQQLNPSDDAVDCEAASELTDPESGVFESASKQNPVN